MTAVRNWPEDEFDDLEDEDEGEDDPQQDEEPIVFDDPDLEADGHRERETFEQLDNGPHCVACGCSALNACPGG